MAYSCEDAKKDIRFYSENHDTLSEEEMEKILLRIFSHIYKGKEIACSSCNLSYMTGGKT